MSTRAYFVIGPAGSGKSSVARVLAGHVAAAYLDKDTVCTHLTEALLELAGTDRDERDKNAYYQSVVMDLEYRTILDLARDNLDLGRPVVLDAPFGRYLADPHYLTEIAARHRWPAGVEPVVVEVRVDGETARGRIEDRGYARDRSKLADWNSFWAKATATRCRWEGATRLAFDNTADGVSSAEVARLLTT
jgi:predicted kinase